MNDQDVLVELDVPALRGGICPENIAGRRAPAWWNRKHRQTLASLPVAERAALATTVTRERRPA